MKQYTYLFFPIICLFLLLSPVTVQAAHDWSYNSADFQVQLNEDGSADITETWHVTYESDDYPIFDRNIYLRVLEPEKAFDVNEDLDEAWASVENLSVKVSGKLCEESNTNGYRARKSGDHFLIGVCQEYEKTDYIFEFSYTLKNIVVKMDDNTTAFVHRFMNIDGEEIQNISVSIQSPVECEFESVVSSEYEETIEGNTVKYYVADTDVFFETKLKLKCEQSFGIEFSEIEPLETIGEFWIFIPCLILGFGSIILYFRSQIKQNQTKQEKFCSATYKDIKSDDIYDILKKWKGKVTAITQVAILTQATSFCIMGIFAELHKKGIVEFFDDNTKISLDIKEYKELHPYQRRFLDLLIACKKEYDYENQKKYKEFPYETFTLDLEYLISFLDKERIHAEYYAEKIKIELEERSQFGYFKEAYIENTEEYTPQYQFEVDVARAQGCIVMMKDEFPVTTFQDVLSDGINGEMNPLTYIAYVFTFEKRYERIEDEEELFVEDLLFAKLVML